MSLHQIVPALISFYLLLSHLRPKHFPLLQPYYLERERELSSCPSNIMKHDGEQLLGIYRLAPCPSAAIQEERLSLAVCLLGHSKILRLAQISAFSSHCRAYPPPAPRNPKPTSAVRCSALDYYSGFKVLLLLLTLDLIARAKPQHLA